ncbi:MAG: glycosyltransferase, partial [Muribaculaceae bacterium]|nr:glycosyltransferase [Muribaculaceae bacterium]
MKKIIRTSTVALSLKTFCLELFDVMRSKYQVLAVASPGPELRTITERGTPAEAVKMERQIAPLADLRSLIELVRLFRRERPDMVHSITPKAGLLSMMAARIAGVPVRMHSFTGLVFPTSHGFKRRLLMLTDRLTCACATHIHAEGQGVRSDLLRYGITKKEVRVLHHGNIRGVDLSHYAADDAMRQKGASIRKRYGMAEDTFVFIFAGRLVRDKGIVELMDAYSRLREEGYRVGLLLVGVEESADPLPEPTHVAIADDPTVYFTAEWTDDLRPYYAAANAMVFPSYREGFPNVVLEAGAMGLPSVVTDINGS